MSDQENLATKMMVTFSKRRKGLYGKASELCTRFDAQIAVLVVSSAGNPFAFGHSSVDQVLRRAAARFCDAGERRIAKDGEAEGVGVRAMQARELAGLLGAWIERKLEACTTMEELKILKIECLALRQKIVEKLRNDESFSGGEEGFGGSEDDGFYRSKGYTQNDMSFHNEVMPLGLQEQNCTYFAMENSDCDGWRNDMLCWGEKAPLVPGYFGPHGQNGALYSGLNDLSFEPEYYNHLRGGTENNLSFSVDKPDGYCASASSGVGVTADQENDMSFSDEFGSSTRSTFDFDFQGYVFDFEREFAEMQRAL